MMTALYRHFDAQGRLLYVGISGSALQRFLSHRNASQWGEQIATMTVEQHDTRARAMEAEKAAIQAENPLWNVQHNKAPALSGWDRIFEEFVADGTFLAHEEHERMFQGPPCPPDVLFRAYRSQLDRRAQ